MLRSKPISMLRCAAPGISAEPAEDNLRYFKVLIFGPASSPYEGNTTLHPSLLGCREQLAYLLNV